MGAKRYHRSGARRVERYSAGVTVEARSPALIEGSRVVITNEEGRYRFVDLRPGTYSLTFTLAGFQSLRRDGVELQAEFTATVKCRPGGGGPSRRRLPSVARRRWSTSST
jgi:hypothetical protein